MGFCGASGPSGYHFTVGKGGFLTGWGALCALAVASVTLTGCTTGEPASVGDLSTRTALPTPHHAPDPTSSATSSTAAFEPQMSIAEFDQPNDVVVVSGYVAGVIEEGGACTFTITGPGAPVSLQTTGEANSTTTSCGNTQTSSVGWPAGTWNVTLTYTSGNLTATSSPLKMQVVR